jgi:hypothetical protein
MTPEVIRFAAALASIGGADAKRNSYAAKLAGMDITRTAAFRIARSVKVKRLLDAASKVATGQRPAVTEAMIDARVDEMINSRDDRASAVGIELRSKRLAAKAARQTQEPDEQETARAILQLCRPTMAPLVWAEIILRECRWHAPFLEELAPYLVAHHAEDWRHYRALLQGEHGQMAGQVDRLESGRLLTLNEILSAIGISKAGATPLAPDIRTASGNGSTEVFDAA